MTRRRLAALALALAVFGAGYWLGNAPDRELRRESHALADATGALIRSCRSALVKTAAVGLTETAREDALGTPNLNGGGG